VSQAGLDRGAGTDDDGVMRLVLFQPDIPQNTGTLIRLGAATATAIDVIEPCGFVWSDRHLKRAGMDYLSLAEVVRWPSWQAYAAASHQGRLVLLTTRGTDAYWHFRFEAHDRILVGRESAGVEAEQHAAADARLVIPMAGEARALNVAVAAAMVLGEALRQQAVPNEG
jgi:tRNA (cytidine/uridine-2'-O-)-methyltransferase